MVTLSGGTAYLPARAEHSNAPYRALLLEAEPAEAVGQMDGNPIVQLSLEYNQRSHSGSHSYLPRVLAIDRGRTAGTVEREFAAALRPTSANMPRRVQAGIIPTLKHCAEHKRDRDAGGRHRQLLRHLAGRPDRR